MNDFEKLEAEINEIKKRNARVELDKAWDTSLFRKFLIALLTYVVITLFFYFLDLEKPFINAIVPTLGFLLSTLSVPLFKDLWIEWCYKNNPK